MGHFRKSTGFIGPIQSYQNIYVAICGEDFPNFQQGRKHEDECCICQKLINELKEESIPYDSL